jgi:hypothetical protein
VKVQDIHESGLDIHESGLERIRPAAHCAGRVVLRISFARTLMSALLTSIYVAQAWTVLTSMELTHVSANKGVL